MKQVSGIEEVKQAIINYQGRILKDFWDEVQKSKLMEDPDLQRVAKDVQPLQDMTQFKSCYEELEDGVFVVLVGILNFIKKDNLETSIMCFYEFIRTANDYADYQKLYDRHVETFKRISKLSIHYRLMKFFLREVDEEF